MSETPSLLFTPPEPFSFVAADFEAWLNRFERYRSITGLASKDEDIQISTLIYSMGPQAEEAFAALKLSIADAAKYDKVKKAFKDFYIPKANIIFERAKFNLRVQEQGESVDAFISDLHTIATKCKYGDLKDELIRDRIVVGIRDAKLSERLQMDDQLTLSAVIAKAKQAELVQGQQQVVRHSSEQASSKVKDSEIANVQRKNKYKPKHNPNNTGNKQSFANSNTSNAKPLSQPCSKCGFAVHNSGVCPAKSVRCRKCSKFCHYAKLCNGSQKSSGVHGIHFDKDDDSVPFFIGSVVKESKPCKQWTINALVGKKKKTKVNFYLDCGADVTCLPAKSYSTQWGPLDSEVSTVKLRGPAGSLLKVTGRVRTHLKCNDKECSAFLYFVDGLQRPLLGRPEIECLDILRVAGIKCDESPIERKKWINQFPSVFSGLGKLKCPYTITLKEGAVPFSCSVPRRVSLPLLSKVETALNKMVAQGVIERVSDPTDWCAPMVVVPKPQTGEVRITTDFIELNKAVKRELFEMPSVDYALGKLGGAKFFFQIGC